MEHTVDFRFAPSQWEMALLYNDVSHWLGASLKSALELLIDTCVNENTDKIICKNMQAMYYIHICFLIVFTW